MRIRKTLLPAIAAVFGIAGAASAGTIYSNPAWPAGGGNCVFSTTCAAALNPGDSIFAAQEFTLANAAVVRSASFTELDYGVVPTSVNWGFWDASGAGGLPGTLLTAGSNTVTSAPSVGSEYGYNLSQVNFGIGSVALDPGTYYFAIQAVSPTFLTFLSAGADTSGAATTYDGGATWEMFYANSYGGVAVSLYDNNSAVPEPQTWAMMLVGFGIMGAAMRSRRKQAAAAA